MCKEEKTLGQDIHMNKVCGIFTCILYPVYLPPLSSPPRQAHVECQLGLGGNVSAHVGGLHQSQVQSVHLRHGLHVPSPAVRGSPCPPPAASLHTAEIQLTLKVDNFQMQIETKFAILRTKVLLCHERGDDYLSNEPNLMLLVQRMPK